MEEEDERSVGFSKSINYVPFAQMYMCLDPVALHEITSDFYLANAEENGRTYIEQWRFRNLRPSK